MMEGTDKTMPRGAMPAQDGAGDEIDLLAYWNILREKRWLVLGCALAALLVALALTLLTTPIFRAGTLLQIERDSLKVVDFQGLQPTESAMDRDFYQTQYELLKSRSLALRVIQDLRLSEQPEFKKIADNAVAAAGKQAGVGNVAATAASIRSNALVTPVLQRLTIEPVRNSRLVRVNFDSPNRQLAARVANAFADAFIASNLERKFDASTYAKKYLEERLAQLKGRLEDSERALVNFSETEQIVSVGDDRPSLSAQQLVDLNTALTRAQDERIKAESAWQQASVGDGMGIPQVLANPLVQTLRGERARVAAEYQQKLGTFKPEYPDMLRLSGQLRELDRQIAREVSNVRHSLQSAYAAASSQERLLNTQIQQLKGDVLSLQGRSIQYNILKRDADTNRQIYDALLQRYKEVGVAGGVSANNISIIDRAEPPTRPHTPRLPLNLAIGLLLGLMLGTLLAFLMHYLDRSVRSPAELQAALGLPVLGAIPRLPEGTTPAQASQDPRSAFSESYRSVRTALQFATSHGLPRNMLVTSAAPTEGKSTTAHELARNIAQLGKRVLLIDGDLRNPSVHHLTALSNSAGLSNILAGAKVPADVVHHLEKDGLDVITSGPIPPNPPELLAGDMLQSVLDFGAAHYDMVIIDGPPVLGLADAPLLSNKVEATLLIASADATTTDALRTAAHRLTSAHARLVGALLVRYHPTGREGEGYGYSYYAYGGDKS